MRRYSTAVFVAVVAAISVARDVAAQGLADVQVAPLDDVAVRAQQLNERGNQAMLEMRYVDALGFYEQSKALSPEQVGVVYSIARAQQMLGAFPEALSALEEFERRASAEQKAIVGQLAKLLADVKSRVSTLHLRSNQAGARVLVNDAIVGTTPLSPTTRLKAGAARVQLELEGFFPEVRELILPPEGVLQLDIELKPRATSALLVVRTEPQNAEVFVDDKRIGTSSPRAEWVVSSGSHRVSARREGYEEAETPVQLPAGATRELSVTLSPTKPVYKRWWFWVATGTVLAGGTGLAVALLKEREPAQGSLGTVSGPLTVEF